MDTSMTTQLVRQNKPLADKHKAKIEGKTFDSFHPHNSAEEREQKR